MDGCKDGWKLACVGLAAWIGCIASSPGRGGAADGRAVTPVNQVLTPAGRQVELPGLRAMQGSEPYPEWATLAAQATDVRRRLGPALHVTEAFTITGLAYEKWYEQQR